MHVMVIGAAGMIGRKLVEAIVADPRATGAEIDRLTLVDVIEPVVPASLSTIGNPALFSRASDDESTESHWNEP